MIESINVCFYIFLLLEFYVLIVKFVLVVEYNVFVIIICIWFMIWNKNKVVICNSYLYNMIKNEF